MIKTKDIVAEIARARKVEKLVHNVTHRPAEELGDLVQIVYEALLKVPDARMSIICRRRALDFYIVRIVENQYFSRSSAYHRHIRRFQQRAKHIADEKLQSN